MIMWEVGSRVIPYEGAYQDLIESLVKQGEREMDLEDCPEGYMELIKLCWSQEPQCRPSIDQIIEEIERIKVTGSKQISYNTPSPLSNTFIVISLYKLIKSITKK